MSYTAISEVAEKSLQPYKDKFKMIILNFQKSTYISEMGFWCSHSTAEAEAEVGKSGDGGSSKEPWGGASSIEIAGGIICTESILIMPCCGCIDAAEPVRKSGNGRCWVAKMSWLWQIRSILHGIISCDAQMLLTLSQVFAWAERTSAVI